MNKSLNAQSNIINSAIEGAQFIIHADDWSKEATREAIHAGEGGTFIYTYQTNKANDKIKINGKIYKVVDSWEFAIKVQKTQIQARDAAAGLMKFLLTFSELDYWEQQIIKTVKTLNH